jgi:hypothetical protein
MPKKIWNPEKVFDVYELAKSGMTASKIAGAIGVTLITFRKWEKKKPLLREAIRRGRKVYKNNCNGGPSFRDYIYKRLPLKLKKLWKEIHKLENVKGGLERINAILEKRGVRVRQHLFIYAWTYSNFSISSALRRVCISRSTFDNWRINDPGFAELVEEIEWHKKNFFEDSLCALIKGGDTAATIFANKTKNRDRGYGEVKKSAIDLNITGEVKHTFVPIENLKLSLSTRKEILECLKAEEKKNNNVGAGRN